MTKCRPLHLCIFPNLWWVAPSRWALNADSLILENYVPKTTGQHPMTAASKLKRMPAMTIIHKAHLAPWLPHLESELFHINVHVSQNVNFVQNNADLSMRTSDPTQSMKDIEKTNADKTKQKVLISNITFCQLFSPPAFIFNLLNLRKKASSSASSGCNHLQVTLLMEEILHHLGGIKPCK